jgi:hypothetical protein
MNTLAQRLFGGSIRACQRRMQLLVAHELVHPMSPTVTFTFGHAGRLATIFRLTARGAEVLATFTGQLIARPRRLQQRPETLLHSLEIAQLQLAVNDACALRGLNEPAWMHELDTYPDLAARTKRRKQEGKALPATDRFVLLERFTLANGRTATCWPDASCRLAIPADDGTVHTLIIDWEIDRSTERVVQVTAKLFGYQAKLNAGVYRKQWPSSDAAAVRIFFVVPSVERLENLAKAFAKCDARAAAAAIRLTTRSELTPERLLTEPIWRTIDDKRLPIWRSPLSSDVPVAS